jgi:AcrR family transcriptional regulator
MATSVRTRILQGALQCFTETGYEQTTIARIRQRSDVTNGALFHHFPNKEAIADALYLEAISSFQEGLWELLRRRPRSVRTAVRDTLSHQLGWIAANQDRARFLYARGHVDWDSPSAAELASLNRKLSDAYRDWMEPLVQSGQVRQMSMVMVGAIVAGPAHAIARRWLEGQLRGELLDYLGELVDAAAAGLSGPSLRGSSRRPAAAETPRRGHLRLELVAEDGSVVAEAEATAELHPAGTSSR